MRGSVIALTNDTGYVVENYCNPFGNLLSKPTIYNSKLSIGRDDVIHDSETELYYMHARYYDPEVGRFIMKNPVEGSLGNPITQNSYIYCANDPALSIFLCKIILLLSPSSFYRKVDFALSLLD